mmetsp:Transcript_31762/g.91287  ORF Transcript_31762/g.91287 Transcript_31762/m.91287 type:complete len:232 (-) Transcript_31762:143-838(-)
MRVVTLATLGVLFCGGDCNRFLQSEVHAGVIDWLHNQVRGSLWFAGMCCRRGKPECARWRLRCSHVSSTKRASLNPIARENLTVSRHEQIRILRATGWEHEEPKLHPLIDHGLDPICFLQLQRRRHTPKGKVRRRLHARQGKALPIWSCTMRWLAHASVGLTGRGTASGIAPAQRTCGSSVTKAGNAGRSVLVIGRGIYVVSGVLCRDDLGSHLQVRAWNPESGVATSDTM